MDNNFNVFAPPPENAEAKKQEYSRLDALVALLLFPICYIVASLDIISTVGRIITFSILFSLALVYMKKSGISLTKNKIALIFGISLLLLNFGVFFTENSAIRLTILAISFFGFPYFIFSLSGNSAEKYPASLFPFELLKAVLVMPFGSLTSSIEAISQNKKSGKIGKGVLMVFLGLAIAFIPCIIVIFLLSYDQGFNCMLDTVLEFGFADVPEILKNIILAFPMALLVFGMLYSGKSRRFSDILNEEKCKKTQNILGFAPSILCVSAVIPFIFVYVIFFISQLEWYLSAFGGNLPEGMTYSSYAKNGFFQLCAVSVINFIIIICISVFVKKNEGKVPLEIKIVNTVFSLATLILIATAFSKMVIYIEVYGLTLLRVLPSAFMVFLSVVFLMILVKQFAEKTNVIIISMVTAILICAILAFSDVDGFIARYNTDRYLAGELEHFEMGMLTELGDSGIIQLDRIVKNSDSKETSDQAEALIEQAISTRRDKGISIPSIKAREIISAKKSSS